MKGRRSVYLRPDPKDRPWVRRKRRLYFGGRLRTTFAVVVIVLFAVSFCSGAETRDEAVRVSLSGSMDE